MEQPPLQPDGESTLSEAREGDPRTCSPPPTPPATTRFPLGWGRARPGLCPEPWGPPPSPHWPGEVGVLSQLIIMTRAWFPVLSTHRHLGSIRKILIPRPVPDPLRQTPWHQAQGSVFLTSFLGGWEAAAWNFSPIYDSAFFKQILTHQWFLGLIE